MRAKDRASRLRLPKNRAVSKGNSPPISIANPASRRQVGKARLSTEKLAVR